jgi:hypothetical protein
MLKGLKSLWNPLVIIEQLKRIMLPLKTNIEKRLSGSCICQLKPREGNRGVEREKRIKS